MKASFVAVIITIVVCALSVEVVKNPLGVAVTSEKELADLILAHIGYNSPSTSDKIKQIIKENKMSVLNSALDVVLLITTGQEKNGEGFSLTKEFLDILDKGIEKVSTHMQVGRSIEEVNKYVEENLEGKIVQHLNINDEEIEEVKKLLISPSRRVLYEVTEVLLETKNAKTVSEVNQVTQTGSPPSSYTFKFFFILVFIIVTFGILAAIAGMENRKDTLLYAKFIADVGR